MCQFTELERVEPQEIFAEKKRRILQALLANIAATDENKNGINTFFTILSTKTAAKIKKLKRIFFFCFHNSVLNDICKERNLTYPSSVYT